jgi:hypothetical protein
MDPVTRFRSPRAGVALLEAMFAVAIFGLAAVALLAAVRDLGRLAVESDVEGHVHARLRGLLEEELRDGAIRERTRTVGPDDFGVRYAISVATERPTNRNGLPLEGLFRIRVRAEWKDGGVAEAREADALRYAPLYR